MDPQTTGGLLCACLRMEPKTETAQRLTLLSPADWHEIIECANAHRVTPLIHQYVQASGLETKLPGGIAQRLREIWLRSAIRNTRLSRGLGQLLEALHEAGIPVIMLKGGHLASLVYDNMALRPMSDLDILVKRADVIHTGERLINLGYTPLRNRWQDVTDAAAHHLPPFVRADAIPVEVHWLITSQVGLLKEVSRSLQVDTEGLWERAEARIIAGVETRVLCPNDLLLHLCIHTLQYEKSGIKLRGFCDIARTIQHYGREIDWGVVQSRAHQWHATRHVYLSLKLAEELVGAVVPSVTLAALEPMVMDDHVMAWAKEEVYGCALETDETLPHLHNLARVKETRGLPAKIQATRTTVFPSREVLARLYPVSPDSGWICAYYVRRLWDLALKYRRVLWRMVRSDAKVMSVAKRDSKANALRAWLGQS